MYVLGIDIGGTKIEAALIEVASNRQAHFRELLLPNQKPLFWRETSRRRTETQRQSGYDSVVSRIVELTQQVLAEADVPASELSGLGMGLPGAVDPRTQMMSNGNTGIFIGRDLRSAVSKQLALTCPVVCANDANCFAVAEALAGAGIEHSTRSGQGPEQVVALGIILGTGVGGGVVSFGRLMAGRRGAAGEWGHIPVETPGLPCYCGNEGCSEAYLSGPGIEAMYVRKLYSQIKARPSAKEIFELAEAQEPAALAIVKHYKRSLGRFLATLSQIFDPDYFVLGGGMSRQVEIYSDLTAHMQTHLFVKNEAPLVYKHVLGDSAGVIGAALLSLIAKT